MNTVKFKVGSKEFELEQALLPKDSYLRMLTTTEMKRETIGDAIVVSEDDEEIPLFEHVVNFLQEGTFPPLSGLDSFSYLGVNPCEDYELASRLEDRMRANMYKDMFTDHPMNTDPHYGLVELTPELWDMIPSDHSFNPDFLFTKIPLKKCSWAQIQKSLSELNRFISLGGVMVAGGRIFSALFGTRVNDVDLFFYGEKDPDVAEKKIARILEMIRPDDSRRIRAEINRLSSLANNLREQIYTAPMQEFERELENVALSLNGLGASFESIQELVIGAYKSIGFEESTGCHSTLFSAYVAGRYMHLPFLKPEERNIVLEFNSLNRQIMNAHKSSRVIITRTANAITFEVFPLILQVILRLYRTPSEVLHGFDVDCCSVGYDGKLWMTQRALHAIWNGWNTVNFGRLSPSYERRLAKYGTRGMAIKVPNFTRKGEKGEELVKYSQEVQGKRGGTDYKKVDSLMGLDMLLYLEFQADKLKYRSVTLKAIDHMAERASDYSQEKKSAGININMICAHLLETRETYPEQAEKYLSHWTGVQQYVDDFDRHPHGFLEYQEKHGVFDKSINFETNMIPKSSHLDFLRTHVYQEDMRELALCFKQICHFHPMLYNILGAVRPWKIPRDIGWKVINPGEQMTGTFHQLVLKDHSTWYTGRFYV